MLDIFFPMRGYRPRFACHAPKSSTLWAKRPSPPDFAQTPLLHFMGETALNHPFRPDSAFPSRAHRPHFMGEIAPNPRFRPDSTSILYGRKRPRPPISPRLRFSTLWAKPPQPIHFAQTQPSRREPTSTALWAKRPSSPDFAQTPPSLRAPIAHIFWAKSHLTLVFAQTPPSRHSDIPAKQSLERRQRRDHKK